MTEAGWRPAVRRLPPLVAATLVLLVLSSCFPTSPSPRPSATGFAHPFRVGPLAPLVAPRVLSYCPPEDAVHDDRYPLPVDEVCICRGDGTRATDGVSSYGPWEAAYRIQRPAALLDAYHAPNARSSSPLCGPFRGDPLIVWVHRNGSTTAYYAPVDACGAPTTAASDAYQKAKRVLLVEVDRGAPDLSKKDSAG